MSAAAPAPIGVIGHYNLLERLDAAGVGDLYRARDTRAGRTVAVRVLPDGFAADAPALVDRIRSVQVLSHPNAIAVFDAGIHENRVYVVFEFLKGGSLRSEMGGGQIRVRRALDVAIQMTDAIAEAHAAGFMHRGLSPESVAITAKGHAKVPAFDLAVQNGLEHVGGVPRLRDCEAPEEAQGGAVDERSDIYSVGAILYEMLTARPPTPRGSAAPSASNPHVRGDLDAVVLKAVAPNPNSRYQAAATFAAALRETAAAMQADEDERIEPERAAPSTSAGGVVLTTLVIVLVLAVIAWWVMSR